MAYYIGTMKQSFELSENLESSEGLEFKENAIKQEQGMLVQFQGEKAKRLVKAFSLVSKLIIG